MKLVYLGLSCLIGLTIARPQFDSINLDGNLDELTDEDCEDDQILPAQVDDDIFIPNQPGYDDLSDDSYGDEDCIDEEVGDDSDLDVDLGIIPEPAFDDMDDIYLDQNADGAAEDEECEEYPEDLANAEDDLSSEIPLDINPAYDDMDDEIEGDCYGEDYGDADSVPLGPGYDDLGFDDDTDILSEADHALIEDDVFMEKQDGLADEECEY